MSIDERVFASKLRAPGHRKEVVARPRLTDRLVDTDALIVLIVAPPGYGKSTLLAQWTDLDRRRFAFVALEPSDNDPAELWTGIVGSMRKVEPAFGESLETSLRSPGGLGIDRFMPQVIREMDRIERLITLVLEDYHQIKDAACHASIESLLTHRPQAVSVVISSRSDPPIPVGRLRASGEVLELRGADLAFSPVETEQLLNDVIGLDLAGDEVALLQEKTEGWAAGLQLATLGLRANSDRAGFLRSFSGSNRHIVDYLVEVVLERVGDLVRGFLLETSILPRFCAPLCDAVTGRSDAAQMIDILDRSDLFLISLDDQRRWYRYHHLFAELLYEELRTQGPERVADLHRAAYRWFEAEGDVDRAIAHAIAAGELEAATGLIASSWSRTAAFGRFASILQRLDAFPAGYVAKDPDLSLVKGWVMAILGRRAEVRNCIEDALAADTDQPLIDGSGTVRQGAALLRAQFPLGDVGEQYAASREVKEKSHDPIAG